MIAKQFGLDPDRDLKFLASGTPEARLAALSQGPHHPSKRTGSIPPFSATFETA